MMKGFWLFLVVLSLLVLLVPACGGETSAPKSTEETPTPTSSRPVKIGAVLPWSGALAASGILGDQVIAVVKQQVQDMGGILGGREVEFVRGDDRGLTAESAAQAIKLITDDKVAILTFGGVHGGSIHAVSEVAEEYHCPFMALSYEVGYARELKYTAGMTGEEVMVARVADFVIDVLKPQTVAWLGYDVESTHMVFDGIEGITVGAVERLKAAGIDVVYGEYFPSDTVDFSPYLTKIKYLNPDVAITLGLQPHYITINKQIEELGGWGKITHYAGSDAAMVEAAIRQPSAVGSYIAAFWTPGSSDDPGAKFFSDTYMQMYGYSPGYGLDYFYNTFWTAIMAIELAGTDDHEQIARAMRSGNLEWESCWGHLRVSTDGVGYVQSKVVQVQEGGTLVQVWP